jgi:hypothetical protein
MGSSRTVDFHLFDSFRQPPSAPTQAALNELAYTLAGVSMPSCLPGKWPVWYNGGELRTLALCAQPHDARYDGLRPLRHAAWQPLRTEGGWQQLDDDAGPSTDVARKAAEELEGLKQRGEHSAEGQCQTE